MFRTQLNLLLVILACAIGIAACGWKPPCAPATLTEPWSKMNLPVQQDAAVCVSSADKLQAAYKADREEIAKMYLDTLAKGGWSLTRKDLGVTDYYDFERGSDKITLQIYDWQKTGVLIKKR